MPSPTKETAKAALANIAADLADKSINHDPFVARKREVYVTAWQEHVQDLAALFLADPSKEAPEHYIRLKRELYAVIERAANALFN
jgi:hypothetical protein